MKKTKVLIVDDSALVRQTLQQLFATDSSIEIVGSAGDPFAAAEIMKRVVPDVITLDIEMPKMDGLTFLRKLMTQHPVPVVICSTLTEQGSDAYMKALEYGAVDVITKPKIGTKKFFEESSIRVCDVVKAAAMTRPSKLSARPMTVQPKLTADAVLPKSRPRTTTLQTTEKVVLVGASTGGTEAIQGFLQSMPLDCPGIAIVQHMPEKFTAAFASRLDTICRITVKEARDGDSILRGQALIAPGNKHMLLKRSGARYYVEIKDGPLVSRHRPSVDVLFRSGASSAGKNAVGVIMTGMGDDGAKGMKEMHDAGTYCIAQDEASCVVFGMPQEAIKLGGVDKIIPLKNIPGAVVNFCNR
ncbi:protein-glutamate methylesterase/protein-glutamine glutaminase [Maridesulfovibrio salexigens]|uniref:Protein-glutamate methylesterase/protein-glutamine glutaminase n=1 Tax=Maridesulfovibrio salexigens (strain ATCC 14822 / DSM 2638 / NCIMB 8403 / VKM B-1763) TaxID=526222 RepID=C6BTV7_MARSD|nr:chemotaxis response regulator protein-glutamate methylesterase [Maridesulfovibrio salexigens]ACS79887.1 response regulator receiver modulated CheB methylesterase [Maridesulfovibrio salexigens DSM 2638]